MTTLPNSVPDPQFKDLPTSSQANASAVDWAKISHQQLTMYPTIDALTRQYFDACEWTGHLDHAFWKQGLPFLTPNICQKIHHYNLKHVSATKKTPNEPPILLPPYIYLHTTQWQQQFPKKLFYHCYTTPPLH